MPDFSKFTKEEIIRRKTAIEAGYVNDPADLGGETIWGITKATATEYGYTGAMKDMPKSLAFEIYDKMWWQRLWLDQVLAIHPLLADRLFDYAINAGRVNAVRSLQRLLNSLNNEEKFYPDQVVDGGMGKNTLAALNAYVNKRGEEGTEILVMALTHCQTYHYLDISEKRKTNERFTYGWFRRVFVEVVEYAKAYLG